MKVTVIANISANGKILLSDAPNHQASEEAMAFYLKFAKQVGNLVVGKKTYQIFQQIPDDKKEVFAGIEIVLLSKEPRATNKHKVADSPEAAVEYLKRKGFGEIAVGGGTQTYNSFLEKELVTDIYFNISPVITGAGGVIGADINLHTAFKLSDHEISNEFAQLHLVR